MVSKSQPYTCSRPGLWVLMHMKAASHARIASLRNWCGTLCLLTALLCSAPTARAQKPMMAVDKALPLSAEQTAEAIGLLPLFARIKEIQAAGDLADREELVVLQQQILLRVISAALQVGTATGQIDAEIADTRELENYLSSRRNSKLAQLDLLNLAISGTFGTANSALGFTDHDLASNLTSLVAGSAAVALSVQALRVRRGTARRLQSSSNMLSEIFSRPSAENDMYPPVVFKFMHAVPPGDTEGLSRQDRLIRSWVEIGRIPPPDSLKGQEKIEHLTSLPHENIKQSIGDLDDRQAMLYDLRVRLNYIQQDLATLLAAIPTMSMKSTKVDGP
jgi:hypothetical protein